MRPSPPTPISSLTRLALPVRARADLKTVETRHKHESAVVVKDPVAMTYHRLRPDEYFVLQSLDGQTSLEQIQQEYQRRFAPQRVSPAELNQLLFRFHQNGLTVSDAAMQGDRLTDRRQKDRRQRWLQHISGVLFIRFPGVDPEPLMRRLYPLVRPLLSRLGVAIAMLICLLAGILFVLHWSQFTSEFPEMHQWLRLSAVLTLAAVIGGSKVCHELGHALTCKHFGGECHQIGPMLLVFTPALYCDTSDSWMLPSRWQRAAVGMAGIATEVLLAALATFVWVATAPGMVHYVAMNVMLVCSLSTLLVNANPLLRYDGYYVLSDLCDVPNLAERSRRLLAGQFNNLAFGFDEGAAEPMTKSARFWMLTYAIMATVYRWSLTLLILWFVSMMLRPYGLESLGRMLCVFAAAGLVWSLLRGPMRFLRHPGRRRQVRFRRAVVSIVTLAGLTAIALYPLPSRVTAPARIVPRAEKAIYINTPGLLREVTKFPGEFVNEGEEVARLVNHKVELEYLAARGRYHTQQQIVEAIRLSALSTPEAANDLPEQEALMEDLDEQLASRKESYDALVLRAPASGRLIAAPRRTESTDQEHRLVSWSGYPTDGRNQDCFVESGQELMSVATDQNWNAELILEQSDIQRIALGAEVKLSLSSLPDRFLSGKVTDISRGQWTAELNAQRRDDPRAARRDQPQSTSYVVLVELQAGDVPLIAAATARSRIEAKPISLVGRVSRLLNGLLRFR